MGKKPPARAATGVSEELHSAARSGNLMAVIDICSRNPLAVNSRDRHSRTPLHLAAWSGQAEVVNYLCKNKADVGAAAMDDMGSVHFAAQKGHLEVIKILVSNGVSIKGVNRKGMSALHYACQGSNTDLIKYLLKRGADKYLKNKAGKTAVDLCSSEEMRKVLVEWNGKTAPGAESDIARDEQVVFENETGKKRKGEETEEGSRNKNPKVALNHLLSGDDDTLTQEQEEDV